jgi:hypothetical protein
MTKEQADFFKRATDSCCNQEIDVRDDYSGRFMYGKSTYGIVVNSITQLMADSIAFVKDMGLDEEKECLENIPDMDNFRTDNMGRDSIIIY